MNKKSVSVRYVKVSEGDFGQRLDNYLMRELKGVPKSHIYRLIRKGEVRVNKKRASVFYKLKIDDSIRIPPVVVSDKAKNVPPSQTTLELLASRILYEDEKVIVINKPSGMSVHAGSTVRIGVIESMRLLYPKLPQLELVHRLDSETSGCLILAKKRSVLRELHTQLREGLVKKIYWTLTQGIWKTNECRVDLPLQKNYRDGGKHVVEVHGGGKASLTFFKEMERYPQSSLMEVTLSTGRTHQIRVHAAHMKHPIAGDDRYGNADFNKSLRQIGLKRMFLHARSVDFTLPGVEKPIHVDAPLDADLLQCIDRLKKT